MIINEALGCEVCGASKPPSLKKNDSFRKDLGFKTFQEVSDAPFGILEPNSINLLNEGIPFRWGNLPGFASST